ncbi:hypothetical protein NEPAR06_0173 [Nematocida parisii]|uniref:Uncharacterized protein n=1 Tax=Nematocida parisii (strain ERTm3) TaxID=935791 RepID=I3EDG2_NEMP3|nr:uncharacterized protein NEPG_00567 [Nematocida parisii ERTm1]EIJ87259.1 hypothetical protein NEQG_02594 [Nematocida parisii ERTm3]KAI5127923.1 hypothetical protein NEPAR03_1203 [Nematocida parisii]EIJ95042.1 hypothetical protein NEPG_00567 [Nematocida parisii ERTm1]KAI5142861.1 hypothetical protein NEPAR04_1681 [Nematocida parisii]KAI5143138.1 hypothetical protein NEPAR07_0500 [Nematocida parisii]|eukprot:XP_013058398.1 hypothetical protein NEPG_00567 [Nematocida parisii ERTm1]
MNETILSLHEPVLGEYVEKFLEEFEERRQEIIVLVTNMPQKHSFANHICEELEGKYTKDKIIELEVDMLKYASKDYFLLTNACLYLERRWNTALIKRILKDALNNEESLAILLSLITESAEEEVCSDFNLDLQITLPENFEEVRKVHAILSDLRSRNIIQSIRDTFTSYKIISAYSGNVYYTVCELNSLIDLESVVFNDIIGGILLSILHAKKDIPYFSNILIRVMKRSRMHTRSFIQLLLTAYNLKDEIWEKLQDIVPHLYVRLGLDRRMGVCLLYTLNLQNAILLYEILNGQVPKIEVFDRCTQGRESTPDDAVRAAVRDIINISHNETYATPASAQHPMSTPGSISKKPPTKYVEIEDKVQFCEFFIKATAPTITHLNNISIEYMDVIKNMTEQEIDLLVGGVLAQHSSLVHKELLVNMIYNLRIK